MAKSIAQARDELRTWLSDLDALKSHVDPGNADAKDFADAWDAALKKAKAAAKDYALAASGP
jgi:hypothetical protein